MLKSENTMYMYNEQLSTCVIYKSENIYKISFVYLFEA